MPTRIELAILEQFLNFGSLTITVANGRCDCLKGKLKGPDVAIHLKTCRLFWSILLQPDLATGEAYMDGSLIIEENDFDPFMVLLMANHSHWQNHWLSKLSLFANDYLAFWHYFNLPGRAKLNVAHHYDLKDSLFDQFLDPLRQYFCGYFHDAGEPITDAQINKLARMGAKLCLQPGHHILDIGCG